MNIDRSREELKETYSRLENSSNNYAAEMKVRQHMVLPFISKYLDINYLDDRYCWLEGFCEGEGSKASKLHPDYCCCYNESGMRIVIETKSWLEKKLDKHIAQLKSYMKFDFNKNKIGIITNGKIYRIYRRDINVDKLDIDLILLCEFDLLEDDGYTTFYLNSILSAARWKMSDLAIKHAEYEFTAINSFREHGVDLTDDTYAKICANHHKDSFKKEDYDELSNIISLSNMKENDNQKPYIWTISDEEDAFSKFVEFKKEHSLIINEYVPNKKYHSILLNGNLNGICGKIENGKLVKKLSKAEKQNIEFFKKNSSATFTILGTVETYNYFYTLFSCLNLDNSEKHLMFMSINNGADFKKVINSLNKKDMKFDVAIVNPPYKRTVYVDIILAMLPFISKHYVGVHPLTYCMYKQGNEKNSLELKRIMRNYETHIFIKNPLDFFPKDANIGQVFGITHIDMTSGESRLFLNEIEKDSFNNIQSYADGNDTLQHIQKILEPLCKKDCVENHLYSLDTSKYKKLPDNEIGKNIYVINITRSTGGQNDYYSKTSKTLISCDKKLNPIMRFKDFNGEYYIETGTSSLKIAERIKETLKTDFMRMTLFVTKPTNELNTAAVTRMMPWFDWTDKMFEGTYQEINERLFEKYIPANIRLKLKAVLAKELPSVY